MLVQEKSFLPLFFNQSWEIFNLKTFQEIMVSYEYCIFLHSYSKSGCLGGLVARQ